MPIKINLKLFTNPMMLQAPPSVRYAFALLILLSLLIANHSAQAFVCGRVNPSSNSGVGSGPSIAWQVRDITFFLNEESIGTIDQNTLGSIEQVRSTLNQAAQTWTNLRRRSNETIDCSQRLQTQAKGVARTDMQINLGGSTLQQYVGYNYLIPQANQNILVFRPNNWYPDLDKRGILGLTTTTFNPVTGHILDADIEFNSEGHIFYSEDLFPNPIPSTLSHVDLLYVASHELGHAIGFNHSNDSNALMFGNAPSNGSFLAKRDLSCDDLIMMLFRYPSDAALGYCPSTDVNPDCGYCQVPLILDYLATIKTLRSDNGGGGFGCQQVSASYWILLGFSILYRAVQKRR